MTPWEQRRAQVQWLSVMTDSESLFATGTSISLSESPRSLVLLGMVLASCTETGQSSFWSERSGRSR